MIYQSRKLKFLSFAVCSLELMISLLVAEIIKCLSGQSLQIKWIFAFVVFYIINGICSLLLQKKHISVAKRFREDTINVFFSRKYADERKSRLAKILEKDTETVITYENEISIRILWRIISISIYLFFLIKNFPMIIVVVVLGLLQGIAPIVFERFFVINYEETMKVEEEIQEFYYKVISNFAKCWFLPEMLLVEQLNNKNKVYCRIGIKSEAMAQKYNAVINIINSLSQIGVCICYVIFANLGLIEISDILVSVYFATMSINSFSELFMHVQYRGEYLGAKKRIREFSNELSGNVTENISDIIAKTHVTIIKGDNGSGKTTLLKRMIQVAKDDVFYTPQNEIKLDIRVKELFEMFDSYKVSEMSNIFNWDNSNNEKKLADLSSGERKLVELMCAFSSGKGLYLDEPEVSLDKSNRERLLKQIKEYPCKIYIATNSELYNALDYAEVIAENV